MAELKTLKEIKTHYIGWCDKCEQDHQVYGVITEELKQEAIKWIKTLDAFWDGHKNGEAVRYNSEHPEWGRIYDLFGAVNHPGDVMTFFVHFFNIADEDLEDLK